MGPDSRSRGRSSVADHNPTPEERDERVKIDADPEKALKILLRTLDDRELDEEDRHGDAS